MNPTPLRILCMEDDADDAALTRLVLKRVIPPPLVQFVAEEASMNEAIDAGVDLILSDYHVKDYSPVNVLQRLQAEDRDVPLIVVSNAVGEGAAMEVLRAGAADYVSKDRLSTLPMVITRVMDMRAQRQRQRDLLMENRLAADRLRRMAAELVSAQERERRTIAQELHDSLGQTLTALLLHLEAADDAPDAAEALRLRTAAHGIVRQSIDQMRSLSFSMRPAQLDLQGLGPTIEMLAAQMLVPAGIGFDLQVQGDEPERGAPQSAVAFRVAQEAFTNAVRHGSPTAMAVRLRFERDGLLRLLIADNGRGFGPGPARMQAARPGGRGLTGMAERCELSGGRLRLRSRPGVGTVLSAHVGRLD